jgi:copper chaperone
MPEYTFYAEMACGGCSGAIIRLLKKLDGVSSVKCDIEKNTVVVVTDKAFSTVDPFITKISAWAKNANKKVSKTPL